MPRDFNAFEIRSRRLRLPASLCNGGVCFLGGTNAQCFAYLPPCLIQREIRPALGIGQLLLRLRRRHRIVLVVDADEDFTLGERSRIDRLVTAEVARCAFEGIQTNEVFLSRVGAVADEAFVGEDGQDFARKINFTFAPTGSAARVRQAVELAKTQRDCEDD